MGSPGGRIVCKSRRCSAQVKASYDSGMMRVTCTNSGTKCSLWDKGCVHNLHKLATRDNGHR